MYRKRDGLKCSIVCSVGSCWHRQEMTGSDLCHVE